MPELVYGIFDVHFRLCWLPEKIAVVGCWRLFWIWRHTAGLRFFWSSFLPVAAWRSFVIWNILAAGWRRMPSTLFFWNSPIFCWKQKASGGITFFWSYWSVCRIFCCFSSGNGELSVSFRSGIIRCFTYCFSDIFSIRHQRRKVFFKCFSKTPAARPIIRSTVFPPFLPMCCRCTQRRCRPTFHPCSGMQLSKPWKESTTPLLAKICLTNVRWCIKIWQRLCAI